MARKKPTRRRSRRNTISLTNTAQGLIVANAMVKGVSNANLYQFFTGRTDHIVLGTAYNPVSTDAIITLPELLGIDRQKQVGRTSTGATYQLTGMAVEPSLQLAQMKENLMANWFSMASTAIVVPIAFKIGKKVTGKTGVTRGVNKVFKLAGLSEVRV
jgi:hypothetical protein